MVNKYLTITEIAEQTDIPNSTCRRYLSTFEAFFMFKGGSRLKKYESSAVNVLKRIKGLYEEGLESHEIFDVLKNEFPLVVNGDEQQREMNEESPTVPGLATSEDIAEIKKALDEQKQFNQALLQEMKQQHLYYEKKFDELKRDRELVSSLRQSMEQRKLESAEHENKTTKQLENIEQQLSEIKQNESVKELAEQVAKLNNQLGQVQAMIKETATSQQETKKGFFSRLFGK